MRLGSLAFLALALSLTLGLGHARAAATPRPTQRPTPGDDEGVLVSGPWRCLGVTTTYHATTTGSHDPALDEPEFEFHKDHSVRITLPDGTKHDATWSLDDSPATQDTLITRGPDPSSNLKYFIYFYPETGNLNLDDPISEPLIPKKVRLYGHR